MTGKGKVGITRKENGDFELIYTESNSILATLSLDDFKRLCHSMDWYQSRMCPKCGTHTSFTRDGHMRDKYYCPNCGWEDIY
jgi:predicted RNA-binding Zn-ribbon protein involved in translation (DUF1610 family)